MLFEKILEPIMIVVLLCGLGIVIISSIVADKIKARCDTKLFKGSLTSVMVQGWILLTISLFYFYNSKLYTQSGGNKICLQNIGKWSRRTSSVLIVIIIMFIMFLFSMSVILKDSYDKLDKDPEDTSAENEREYTKCDSNKEVPALIWALLSLSVLQMTAVFGYIGYKAYKFYKEE